MKRGGFFAFFIQEQKRRLFSKNAGGDGWRFVGEFEMADFITKKILEGLNAGCKWPAPDFATASQLIPDENGLIEIPEKLLEKLIGLCQAPNKASSDASAIFFKTKFAIPEKIFGELIRGQNTGIGIQAFKMKAEDGAVLVEKAMLLQLVANSTQDHAVHAVKKIMNS